MDLVMKKFLACIAASAGVWFMWMLLTMLSYIAMDGSTPTLPWPYRIFWISASMATAVPVNYLIARSGKIDL